MIKPRGKTIDIDSAFSLTKDPRYRADGTNDGAILADISRRLGACGDAVAAYTATRIDMDERVRIAALGVVRDPVRVCSIATIAAVEQSAAAEELALGALARLDRGMGLIAEPLERTRVQLRLELIARKGTPRVSVAAIRMITSASFLRTMAFDEKRPEVKNAAIHRHLVLSFNYVRRNRIE